MFWDVLFSKEVIDEVLKITWFFFEGGRTYSTTGFDFISILGRTFSIFLVCQKC